ncbi:MAG: hypothetical protein RBG13Loki_1434 [Promethearchaeota archaeon CR_4]|nr:MAG: hypothetical protein RBG13Loki_1434 [Candidatus Lokiarchaeota archaeon CR_4]
MASYVASYEILFAYLVQIYGHEERIVVILDDFLRDRFYPFQNQEPQ